MLTSLASATTFVDPRYRGFLGKTRFAEKSKRSHTSRRNDFAMRSMTAGLGHPWPNSRVAILRELMPTFAAYSSRLHPARSRNSRILAPSWVCNLDTA
jgi:hypothetical protein